MRRLLLPLLLAAPLAAQALCSSDDVPAVATLVERFTPADCQACWRERGAESAADTLVLDWILPGPAGQGAALPGAPSDDAAERLQWLRHRPARTVETVTSTRQGQPAQLRIAHGEPFNDYVGVSMELPDAGSAAWNAWLLLVERVPAGTAGTPVDRNVVRKVFRPDGWARRGRASGALAEARSMQLPKGTRPDRLRLVGVLQDGRGQVRAITQTACRD